MLIKQKSAKQRRMLQNRNAERAKELGIKYIPKEKKTKGKKKKKEKKDSKETEENSNETNIANDNEKDKT